MERTRIGMKRDGMNFVFTPGKGGSLIGRPLVKKPKVPLDAPVTSRARVIGPRKGMEGAFKIGSVRG